MSWFDTAIVAALGGLFSLWLESTRVREIAVERARSQCHANGVQFLDDTASLAKMKLARDPNGRLTLQRTYTFEFSTTGNDRQLGRITMLGQAVQRLYFDPPVMDAEVTLH